MPLRKKLEIVPGTIRSNTLSFSGITRVYSSLVTATKAGYETMAKDFNVTPLGDFYRDTREVMGTLIAPTEGKQQGFFVFINLTTLLQPLGR